MRKFLLFIAMSFLLIGCSDDGANVDVNTITSDDLLTQYEENNLSDGKVYIDVREEDEFSESHIEGFENYPMDALLEDTSVLPKDKEIVILCNTQNRSFKVAEALVEEGFDKEKITVVEGGISNWDGPTKSN